MVVCEDDLSISERYLIQFSSLDIFHKSEYNFHVEWYTFFESKDDNVDGYVTAKEMAGQWGVSVRQVQFWCSEGKIKGVTQFGKSWAIPESTPKPTRTAKMKPGRKPKKTQVIF